MTIEILVINLGKNSCSLDGLDATGRAGARGIYLSPYSPNFNPIEHIFAKLKALLRTAAARTADDLVIAI